MLHFEGRMSDGKHVVEFEGKRYTLNDRQNLFVQRLRAAMESCLEGTTQAGAVIEINAEAQMRGFYWVNSDRNYDPLLLEWGRFEGYLRKEAAVLQGNAPEANRSAVKN